jgi:hypothetical protein
MRQTELHLANEDRELIESYRAKGVHRAREVNRAHILSALDRGIPEAQIMAVLGVGRTAVWRTRSAYLEGGAEYALQDIERPGKPRTYNTDVAAKISALACSAPPREPSVRSNEQVVTQKKTGNFHSPCRFFNLGSSRRGSGYQAP